MAGEAWDTASLDALPPVAPAVILLALTLTGLSAGVGLTEIRRRFPAVPIVALAPHEEDECLALPHPRAGARPAFDPGENALPAIDCLTLAVLQGARGAVRRGIAPEELERALLEVARGGLWYDDALSRRIVTWARLSRRGGAEPILSPREIDVAERLAEGASNKEIAAMLELSEATVKRHVGHLLRRFRLLDRLQLGLFLTRHAYLLDRATPSRGGRRGR